MSTTSLSRLPHEQVREALRLIGGGIPPTSRKASQRALREAFEGPGAVRAIIDRAPEGARSAFLRLVHDGAAPVEELIGRGWWGHGLLPSPLDWLQRRALVVVGPDGLVHPTEEARANLLELVLDVAPAAHAPAPVSVEEAGSVVIAPDAPALDRAMAVPAAALRAVAPTVAISPKAAATVTAALRAAGVSMAADDVVAAAAGPEVPLPGTAEQAVGPRAVRQLFERAVAEGRQVRVQYFASSRGGAATDRIVDPWGFQDDLLRGYCHLRRGERTFAVDRVGRALLLANPVQVAAPGPPAG